jgi:protein-S-isoprenylcysteine O-methyltransferase Ste14
VNRGRALVGSLAFLVLAPGTVAGLVPFLLSRWRAGPPLLGLAVVPWIGGALVAGGLAVLLDSFARFALRGLGTPAPVAPPTRLVVTGLYRHVRNPMYVAILAVVGGQALLLTDLGVAVWGALLWLAFHLFVVGYEEPALRSRFGAEYDRFREGVPRWIPRARGWSG